MSTFPPPPAAPPPPPPPGFPHYNAPAPGSAPTNAYASFGVRLGGYLLDQLLYGLVLAAFIVPAVVLGFAAFADCEVLDDEVLCPAGSPKGGLLAGGILIGLVGFIFVVVLYLRALGRTGQTWGRRIVGVKVVRRDTGEPIGIGRALGRSLFASLFSAQILYLGYLWMLWDGQRQTWHDKVVSSVVIRV